MALIVEDGTVVAGAESYLSAADADTYHDSRGNVAWIGSTVDKEAALRRATDYMVQFYRQRWKGVLVSAAQVLDWPRAYVQREGFERGMSGYYPYLMVANNIVPTLVQNACAELALKSMAGPLLGDESQVVEHEQVGTLSVTYSRYSPQRTRYPQIDGMLIEFLLPGATGTSIGLVRA